MGPGHRSIRSLFSRVGAGRAQLSSSRTPVTPVSPPVRFPPGDSEATSFTIACNYCVVGCGYRAYVWDPARGSEVPSERVPHMSPSWRPERCPSTAQSRLRLPDLACPVNRGNYSIRGGTLGRTLTAPTTEGQSADAPEPAATRERLTTPMIRLSAGGWAAMDWDETLELMCWHHRRRPSFWLGRLDALPSSLWIPRHFCSRISRPTDPARRTDDPRADGVGSGGSKDFSVL